MNSFKNRLELEKAGQCACYYCFSTYPVTDIEEDDWTDERLTAICPICQIDAVVPVTSTTKPVIKDILKALYDYWFKVD